MKPAGDLTDWRTHLYRLFREAEFSGNGGPFFSTAFRPELDRIAADWLAIRDEYRATPAGQFLNYNDTGLPNIPENWKLLPLYAWGAPVAANCRTCPTTARLLKGLPGMVSAAFSAIAPGTEIRPHRGAPQGVIRCHLGLITPDAGDASRCALEVNGEARPFYEGQWLNFDDACLHRAWNRGTATRVTLIVDVLFNPHHRKLIHRAVLAAERTNYLRNRIAQHLASTFHPRS